MDPWGLEDTIKVGFIPSPRGFLVAGDWVNSRERKPLKELMQEPKREETGAQNGVVGAMLARSSQTRDTS